MRTALFAVLALSLSSALRADSTWMLTSSEIAYHADHAFHNTVGRTKEAKGKGVCGKNGCDFLVAAPVKSFDSNDSNRDLHMLQAVNGGQYPMVMVKTHLTKEPAADFTADLTVDFGGKSILYSKVAFKVTDASAGGFTAQGQIPLILSQHNVKRPSLLGVAIKDSAPVDVTTSWKKQ